jgi:hypothetical protein
MLDLNTGAKLGEVAMPEGTLVPPAVAKGTIYVLTQNGELMALR